MHCPLAPSLQLAARALLIEQLSARAYLGVVLEGRWEGRRCFLNMSGKTQHKGKIRKVRKSLGAFAFASFYASASVENRTSQQS